MSWSKGDLVLAWTDQVKMDAHPALAEVRFRARQRPRDPWEYDMLPAASVKEVTYSITDTQSSCSCKQRRHSAKSNPFTIYVSYSAVNISVVARNAAGFSPAAVVSVGLIATAGHKICDTTLLGKQVKKRTCLELYEFQDGDWRPAEAINSTTGIYSNKIPLTEPLDFAVFGESSTSVNLSWKAIPIGKLRGFLSHYKLCSLQLHSEQTDEVCYNVSAFATEHRLVNLTPGSKYNISLAAVTREGEGPQVIRIVNTLPENMTGKPSAVSKPPG
ncbi:unnamed protein product [Tetraodon nigroviridis]|uniref:(spotted green pufferfish) hypothetical protein n=1 Tax=Tetraodon nigroviridis TaxID=99883 RepID=Q4SFH4_TETNG|nr:unnamed protein product [Tetraodon nigroviridis]